MHGAAGGGARRPARRDRARRSLPLDILAQHIVAEVAAQEWATDDLYRAGAPRAPYHDLSRGAVRRGARPGRPTASRPAGAAAARYVHHDAVNGELRGAQRRPAGGGDVGRRDPRDRRLPRAGRARRHASSARSTRTGPSSRWPATSSCWAPTRGRSAGSKPGVVRVRDAGDAPPTVPFWRGEAPARTAELSAEVSALRRRVDEHLARRAIPTARGAWLIETRRDRRRRGRDDRRLPGRGPRRARASCPPSRHLVLERFFDDTGGMQLVLHSPVRRRASTAASGSRCARSSAARSTSSCRPPPPTTRSCCRSGRTHSFPLEEVPRFVSSRTVDDTLEHAILDSPMFQARWRWNLNRSLMVLRFRNGRRNPPPIQRMESDDLLAAVFPQAAACQDNIVGPIEIPDHVLVRQTIDDTLHEALDIDGVRALLERIEAGEVRVHCRDTTEPSVLAHEIITARPYAFLDDEEPQNRRTNAVHLRRGLPVDLATIGALDQDAIERVHAEITPDPETRRRPARPAVVGSCSGRATEWSRAVARAGRARPRPGASSTTAWSSGRRPKRWRGARGRSPATTPRSSRLLRGHLELCRRHDGRRAGARRRPSPPAQVTFGLAALRARGLRDAGPLRGSGRRDASGWRAACWRACTATPSGRGARASSRVTAQDFMRFLLRWQHVAPDTQLAGEAGLLAVLEQLQGFEAAAAAWEPELLARRLRHYEPGLARRAVPRRRGRLAAAHAPARDDADAPAGTPSKATPIAVVLRADLALAARRRARAAPSWPSPSVGATAEVLEVLRERGASFATDLVAATRRLPDDVERALWDGVARGLVMCDGFAAIRLASSGIRRRAGTAGRMLAGCARGAARAGRRPGGGRWCPAPAPTWTATIWPRPSPSSCSTAGACCSATWRSTTRCGCRGARSSGRCAGSRIAAWCAAGGSSAGSAASSTRSRSRRAARPGPQGAARTGERVVVNATDPLTWSASSCPAPPFRRYAPPGRLRRRHPGECGRTGSRDGLRQRRGGHTDGGAKRLALPRCVLGSGHPGLPDDSSPNRSARERA